MPKTIRTKTIDLAGARAIVAEGRDVEFTVEMVLTWTTGVSMGRDELARITAAKGGDRETVFDDLIADLIYIDPDAIISEAVPEAQITSITIDGTDADLDLSGDYEEDEDDAEVTP